MKNKILLGYTALLSKIIITKVKKKKNILTGPDSRQICKNYEGFVIAKYIFNNNFTNQYYKDIISRLINIMKKDKKNPIFLKVKHNSIKYQYRDFSKINKLELAKKIITKGSLPKWGKWEMDNLPLKIFIDKQSFSLVFSHAFIDGFNFFTNVFVKIMCPSTVMFPIKLPVHHYIPIRDEVNMLKSGLEIISMKKRILRCEDWKNRTSAKNINCNFDNTIIKKYKNQNNVSYIVSLTSLILKSLFLTIDKKINYLNIFIVAALDNQTCFNNIGGISFSVKRSNNLDSLCTKINKCLKKRRGQILSTYTVTNLLDINTSFYNKIDVVLSSIPFSKGKIYAEKNTVLIDGELDLPFSSAPVYIFGCSYNKTQLLSINCNSPDIKKSRLLNSLKNNLGKGSFKIGEDILK